METRRDNPFPGIIPFIEWEGFWRDFHNTLINYVREALLSRLPTGYDARIEEDALLIDPTSGQWHRYPDVAVLQAAQRPVSASPGGLATLDAATEIEPEPIRADQERHIWIEVRDQRDDSLVTSIEILSPSNKVGNGRAEFRFKRKELFDAGVNLVDIDLLLGGQRLPFKQPLPNGEFFGFVSRQSKAPLVQVYPMKLNEPLKAVPIPLRDPDPDVILELQPAYDLAFSRGGYPRRLRYTNAPAEVAPGIVDWARKITQSRSPE
jgi:hypothetical protein